MSCIFTSDDRLVRQENQSHVNSPSKSDRVIAVFGIHHLFLLAVLFLSSSLPPYLSLSLSVSIPLSLSLSPPPPPSLSLSRLKWQCHNIQ